MIIADDGSGGRSYEISNGAWTRGWRGSPSWPSPYPSLAWRGALVVRAVGYDLSLGAALGVWRLSMPARYLSGSMWHVATRDHMADGHRVPAEGVLASSAV